MKNRPTHPELVAALRSLAASDADALPPPDLESRLLAEFEGTRAAASHHPPAPRFVPAWAALSATTAFALLLLSHRTPMPRPAGTQTAADAPFVQVPYVVPPAPYERVEVIRQDVPLAALIAAGFEVHVDDAGGTLPADVLVGQDGRVLAVRLPAARTERKIP